MLSIISQDSITNGGTQEHIVVKNHSFVLVVESTVPLHGRRISAKLIYDVSESTGEIRFVNYVKNPPLDYKGIFKDFFNIPFKHKFRDLH